MSYEKGERPMPSRTRVWLGRDQRGITGLETAIILIAFVVVASVFAYTVLSAGIFSSERGKEAIHAGLETARGSMELVGSVKATSVAATTLDDVDAPGGWTPSTNVTIATDTSDRKEGTASGDITTATSFTTGLIAYKDITSLDISNHYSARLWIKSSSNTSDGDLRLVIDESAGCGSPEETINLPALTADTWKHALVKMTTPSALDAVLCVGLKTDNTDPGDKTITIDLIEAPAEVTELNFVVANALDGEAINLTSSTDTDTDGLISDESTKVHVVSVIYQDTDQRTADVAWTQTELGKGDGDKLLEPGEKMRITVKTYGADPMPVADTTFNLSMVREQGSDLTLERTLPQVLNTQMDLN